MVAPTHAPLIFLLLPLCIAVGGMVLLPSLMTSLARTQACIITLGTLLLTLLAIAFLTPQSGTTIAFHLPLLMAVGCFCALTIAAPLLDRARTLGSIVAASIGGMSALASAVWLWDQTPAITPLFILYVSLIVAALVSFAGSALLPMSPLRFHATGATRDHGANSLPRLSGWVLLAIGILTIAHLLQPSIALLPVLTCALVAALVSLLTADRADALQKSGEALLASLLISLLAQLTLSTACLGGLVAALCVSRSEAIAQAIRLDDPLHAIGALLLPAMVGLLLPGLLGDIGQLAASLRILGFAVLSAAAISIVLWPMVTIFLGLALPARLTREGIHH